jgi:hypothetical protein
MPKNRIFLKAKTFNKSVKRAFRIGPRKSGVSAYILSNDELCQLLNDKGKAKFKNNILAVLKMRGKKC